MKNIVYALGVAGLAIGLGACNGGDNNNNSNSNSSPDSGSTPPAAVTQPPAGLDFTSFVKQDLQGTSDRNDPLPVNDLTFEFNDKNNSGAYDDVIGSGS